MTKKAILLQPNKRKPIQKQLETTADTISRKSKKPKSRVDEIMQEMGI